MSHPFYWPGQYYFYPIGNTAAVCLTRDLPPEEDAKLLLLGCGDPRHVLSTIYSESEEATRKLDFTCVDFEPGVLARNALLFTLIVDKVPGATIWNIFYHLYIDGASHKIVLNQCKKLVDHSANLNSWRTSPYGKYLRFATEYTLSEIRRYWSLYVAMPDLPSSRQTAIREAFGRVFKAAKNDTTTPLISARSAGPLLLQAAEVGSKQTKEYWRTGTTFSNPKDIAAAQLVNPTLAYCLAGEGCSVHYGTDPLTCFHSAALFGNARSRVTPSDMVKAAKQQFGDWCAAFLGAVSRPDPILRIRFFLAEATAACRALKSFAITQTLNLGIPVSQFCTQLIRLDRDEYATDQAPAAFNVIETSNLIDHIGLLNILVAATPVMSPSISSVLYTESLLFRAEDATREFTALLYGDIGTMGLVLNICPVDYLSGFSTRSNTHELIMHQFLGTKDQTKQSQFHQVTTWKSPASCDSVVALNDGRPRLPPYFDPLQLGTLLFDIYHDVFEQEDSMTFLRQNRQNLLRAITSSNIIHYMREGFVLFLKLVRERLRLSQRQWDEVMDRFLDLETEDKTMPMNTVNRNDFYAHLHRQGVYTVEYYRTARAQKIGRFSGWSIVPPVVRVILSIPRERIRAFEDVLDKARVGTPPMHCDVKGFWSHNIFCAVHVAYGKVISIGTKSNPRVVFEEDKEGRKGTHPLVVSFVLPSMLLTDIEPPQALKVRLTVRSTPGTVALHSHLGLDLEVFSAPLMDQEHVYVLPEQPVPFVDIEAPTGSMLSQNATLQTEIGKQDAVVVELDQQCELVSTLTARVNVENEEVVSSFGGGAMPESFQKSPCLMRLSVAGCVQDVAFPFPVIGTQKKLRLARKSRYIEIVVPVAGPFLKPDGMKLNPFPVVGSEKALVPWSMHRVNLSRLPVLDPKASQLEWLNTHVGSMLSVRERKMRKKRKADGMLFVKDTIHTIFVRSVGIQGGAPKRVFALRDETTNNCDTVFFISGMRYDLPSHSMVCDGYVLPLTHEMLPRIERFFGQLLHGGDMVSVRIFEGEMETWKQLIPAFVERCRSWEHTANCEYIARKEVPLTQQMELDPLCSCGRGKDVEELKKVPEWSRYAPFVTRIAISPLFAVSYLEAVSRDPAAHRCSVCRGRGKPKMMTCSGCQKVRYCGAACQKKDWPRHKVKCKS